MTDSPPPAVSPPVHAKRFQDAIERWFAAHIHNSPVSRSVEALNHLRTVIGHLETEIVDAIKKEI
jgi:hypothetical protein